MCGPHGLVCDNTLRTCIKPSVPITRPNSNIVCYTEFLELERQANERHKNRVRRRPKVNMEFVPEYNIDVPRAPAFRSE
ncbi:hypothetical protein DPMN_151957 [Dreissena polymorpha]|uniref:Uncharacterized protein n=1 Tax=Dreissena polymorpha TaxID=45954 RepID=A0A9D4FJH8_DREPO|nr:hypothetical protein DPMN_151957 [Dreissena polymorpha]